MGTQVMNPRTVEDVIKDFKGRRAGIIRALTKDVEKFYQSCDPNCPNLCLYGFSDQRWEVNLPPPSDLLPEPRLGINFVRNTMTKHEWLSMVAMHSEAWLYSLASYFASKFSFDKADKKRLFNRITDFGSILEVLKGKAKKRAKLEGGGLPEHVLVEEVLSRLPVRELLKYRSVCKMWRSLIDDLDFVSIHLKNYKNNINSEVSHLLIMYRAPRNWAGDEQLLVRRGDTFRKVTELPNSFGAYDVMSYVNGVILLRKGKSRLFREIVLWNPSINKSLNVPNFMFEDIQDATFFELGLGYDPSKNDYKVVAIVYPHAEVKYSFGVRYRATFPGYVQVYTLSTNSWSSHLGVSPPPCWSCGKQVYVNGAIHWINFGPNVTDDSWFKDKDSYIASFDVENEVFKYIELPSSMTSDSEPNDKFPTVFGESLAVFCAHNEGRIDIWVMKEYGVSNSWSKSYTFTLQYDKLLHFQSNGELLFALDWKGIKSYDVKKQKVRDLAKTYSRSSKYTVYTYIESLVLSKQGIKRP